MDQEPILEPLANHEGLQRAAFLLADANDDSWDGLLPILQRLQVDDPATWQGLAVATLETMANRNACEALARDPWNSVAPLITHLLQGLADRPPSDPSRAVRAVRTLFRALRSVDPVTWPDGLPGAVAHLARTWVGLGTPLIAGFVLALDHSRLPDLLHCKRTTRRELRSLRSVAADLMLIDAIDAALATPARTAGAACSNTP